LKLVWEAAGVIGVDPGPLTLRELVWMAEAKARNEWTHTSAVMALMANAHRDPKKTRVFTPADFNPYATSERKRPVVDATTKDLSILKSVFINNRLENNR